MKSKNTSIVFAVITGICACLVLPLRHTNLVMLYSGKGDIPEAQLTFGLSKWMGYHNQPGYYEFDLYIWFVIFGAASLVLYLIEKNTKQKIVAFFNKLILLSITLFSVTLLLNFDRLEFLGQDNFRKDIFGGREVFRGLGFKMNLYEFAIVIYSFVLGVILFCFNVAVTTISIFYKKIKVPKQKSPMKDILDDGFY